MAAVRSKTRYYFFKSTESSPFYLEALPGQTFPDGTAVKAGTPIIAPRGKAQNYPPGTVFCSMHLEEAKTMNGNNVYTVYDEKNSRPPVFHPVSDDPDFKYADPADRNDTMNIAYVKFYTFGKQDSGDGDSSQKKKAQAAVRHTPADPKGYAREPDSVLPDLYDDHQIDEETRLIVLWMRRLCADIGIIRAAIPPMTNGAVTEKIEKLYYCGENIDTITSRKRFTSHMDNDDKNVQALSAVDGGPLIWYLDRLIDEHTGKEPCTAVARDAVHNADDLADAALLLNTRMNDLHATTNPITDAAAKDLAKALGDGWYLDEILRPEILSQRESLEALAAALASGAIPMPEHEGDMRHSYIGKLLADRRNACPKDAEGFHVDELTWTLLLRNLHRRKPTMLTGPTGAGKTQVVQLLCERTGTPLTVIPMGTVTDPTEQLVGKMDLDPATGGTRFDWADFALAIQRPGVILLDEINRCPRNGNNILFSVLDGTATLSAAGAKSSDQRSIRVHPDCVFFATANIGYEYTGTSEIDIALRNRFMEVELDYLDAATEAKVLHARTGVDYDDARNIAQIATGIRKSHCNGTLQKAVSMRETLNCAELVRDGLPVVQACEAAFLPGFDKGTGERDAGSERGKVRALIASRFNA